MKNLLKLSTIYLMTLVGVIYAIITKKNNIKFFVKYSTTLHAQNYGKVYFGWDVWRNAKFHLSANQYN
jgi:hypothetical protein